MQHNTGPAGYYYPRAFVKAKFNIEVFYEDAMSPAEIQRCGHNTRPGMLGQKGIRLDGRFTAPAVYFRARDVVKQQANKRQAEEENSSSDSNSSDSETPEFSGASSSRSTKPNIVQRSAEETGARPKERGSGKGGKAGDKKSDKTRTPIP